MKKAKRPRLRRPEPLVVLGHRVDPEVKEMLEQVSEWRGQPQREVLEQAIRDFYRSVGLRMST